MKRYLVKLYMNGASEFTALVVIQASSYNEASALVRGHIDHETRTGRYKYVVYWLIVTEIDRDTAEDVCVSVEDALSHIALSYEESLRAS